MDAAAPPAVAVRLHPNPDAKDVIKTFDVVEDRVQFILEGHWSGILGKALHVPIMSVYTVKGDHIVSGTAYYDRKAP